MTQLGTVENLGFDDKNYERRRRLDAIASCPNCGAEIECWADTEEWTQTTDGRWEHAGYGGSLGFCEKCRNIIADCLSDGFRCFKMGE